MLILCIFEMGKLPESCGPGLPEPKHVIFGAATYFYATIVLISNGSILNNLGGKQKREKETRRFSSWLTFSIRLSAGLAEREKPLTTSHSLPKKLTTK